MANTVKITASTLRIILVCLLVILIAGGTAGFIFIKAKLAEKASEVASISTTVANSQDELQQLRRAQEELTANEDAEKKAEAMIAVSMKYTYQDQIIESLKQLGDSAGVKVTNIDFTSSSQVGASAAPASGQGAPAPAPSASSIASDVKLTQASVALETPTRYDNLMRFLRYVEQNTMSMKVSKISMSSSGKDKSGHILVSCQTLTIGVYMR